MPHYSEQKKKKLKPQKYLTTICLHNIKEVEYIEYPTLNHKLFETTISNMLFSLWGSNILSSSNFFPGTANYRGGSGSSPDSTGAAEDTLTGCCVSTPSSEALDQVSDLRHSRTLPKRAGIISNENVSSNGLKVKETY